MNLGYFLLDKKYAFLSVILLSLFSTGLTFIDIKYARIFFFIAAYLSIIYLFIWRLKPLVSFQWITLAVVLLGLSKLIWFCLYYIGSPDYNRYNAYLACGKRLLLAAFVAWFLFSLAPRYLSASGNIIKVSLVTAFVLATGVGIFQYLHGVPRVDFYQGRATDAAYMYSALSLVTLFILINRQDKRWSLVLGALVFLISCFLIFSSGTRNVIVTFPFITITIFLLKFRHLGLGKPGIFFLLIGLLCTASYPVYILPKINKTINEVHVFNQNDGNQFTSLSARLAMWRFGVNSFIRHPLGSSSENRKHHFSDYVNFYHRDEAAKDFINVHLHNELIETASLQGVFGIVALLLFYGILLAHAFRHNNALLLSVVLVLMVSGLTDVIFISREQCIFFSLMIISTALVNKDSVEKKSKRFQL